MTVLAALGLACRAQSPAPNVGVPGNRVESAPPSDFEITLERTRCDKSVRDPPGPPGSGVSTFHLLGPCPAYRVTITGDGRVLWTGVEDVGVIGVRNGQIAWTELQRLKATIDRIHFFELDDDGYPCVMEGSGGVCGGVSCTYMDEASHLVIVVRRHGETHQTDAPCPSEVLEDFAAEIGRAAGTARWIRR